MTALDLIKELNEIVPTILPGQLVPKRWSPDGIVRSQPVLKDFQFLLRAFQVMREIAKQECHKMLPSYPPQDFVDFTFEQRMKQKE